MVRRLVVAFGVLALLGAACGKEGAGTARPAVTIQVDTADNALNLEAIAFFPNSVTVHPGDTVRFRSNFRGEPHTVSLGTKIDQGLAIFDKLTDEEKQSEEPPPAVAKLKIPDFFPHIEGPFDVRTVKLGQAAAQPCFLDAGDPPANGPCAEREQPEFNGTQALFNSGWLADDERFSVKLANSIQPGTYSFFCLVHGPEMRGKVVVVPSSQAAQTAIEADAAGKAQLNKLVTQFQSEVDKANRGSGPGKVSAGVQMENAPAEATIFAPRDISIPVGGTVTWKLGFHTVSFNAPTGARPDVMRTADGTVELNQQTFLPAHSPTPPQPSGGGESKEPPPPLTVNAGKWDGNGFLNSGSIEAQGDVLYKLTFTKAGTYKYVCLIHTDMEGIVKVG